MSMKDKPACILSVDVEALPMRASDNHVDTLIYGHIDREEWGIGKMMDIADRHNIKMTFFLDFAEVEAYGDEIIKVGKYIAQRGHDLQIHCHYKLLERKVRERFPNAGISYYTWYEDNEISGYMVDYCLKQYEKCTKNTTVIFRGGEYRFGKTLLKELKKRELQQIPVIVIFDRLKSLFTSNLSLRTDLWSFLLALFPSMGILH